MGRSRDVFNSDEDPTQGRNKDTTADISQDAAATNYKDLLQRDIQ